MPEDDRWQQYMREWRRLSPDRRRAAILELSAEDREAFRAVLANRRSGALAAGAGPGEAPSRLPLLLGLLVCAVLAWILVRERRGPEPPPASAGLVALEPSRPGVWPHWLPGNLVAAKPGVLELVDLVRSLAGGSWHTEDGLGSPIRWYTAQPIREIADYYRNGEVEVTVNGGLTTAGQLRMPWDVVLNGATLDRANFITLEQRGPSYYLAGFELWRYLQTKGWPALREVRCPFDANATTWFHFTFSKPFWLEDASVCDATACRLVLRIYLDDRADNVKCVYQTDRAKAR